MKSPTRSILIQVNTLLWLVALRGDNLDYSATMEQHLQQHMVPYTDCLRRR